MDDLVERARAALDGVTPGPWARDCWDILGQSKGTGHVCEVSKPNGDDDDFWTPGEADANARFIAAARSLVPEMADHIAALEAENARAEGLLKEAVEALERLHQWSEAYPVEVFPEPDFVAVRAALESAGLTLDAISASNMRHVLKGVGDITSAILARIKEAGHG